MKKSLTTIVVLILAMTTMMISCTQDSQISSPEDFYKDKTIDFTTTGNAATFNDLSAQIITSYLARDTGATAIVTNRKGAGSLEGMNYIYKSNPDGLTLGTVASAKFVSNKVMDEPVAEYDLDKFSYIMSIDNQPQVFFVSQEGAFQSITDLKAGQNIKIGATSPSGPFSLGGLTVIKLLGLDASVVTGFNLISDIDLALMRGEISGCCRGILTAMPGVDAGILRPLFVLSTERSQLMPDVPAITELVNLGDQDLALVGLWSTAFTTSNLLVAPRDLPEDRLLFLRGLAEQWVQDDEFRREINQAAGYEVDYYLVGDEASQVILNAAANMDLYRDVFTELIEKYRT